MAARLESPITPHQKAIIDEYYSNGFNSMAAYCKVKGIKEPKDSKERVSIQNIVSIALKANPEYIAKVEAKEEKKHGKMRDRLVNKLEDVANTYEQLVAIALQDGELSDEDAAKFKRLKSIMTTKDYNKAVDILAKLTGSYTPEQVEVTNTFTVSWGEQPKLQGNRPAIDVDHEEVEE